MLRQGKNVQKQKSKKAVAKKAPVKKAKRTIKTVAKKNTIAQARSFQPTALQRDSNCAPNGWVEGPKGVKRPISPSIQIWKFTPTAYLHVASRVSGAVLAGGMTVAGLYGATIGCDIPQALDAIKINAPILVPLLKMSIVFPLAYHGLHGAKQIYQDFTTKGYDQEFQDKSTYAVAGASTLATLYLGLGV